MSLQTKFIENKIFYDGSQLRTQYAYLEHGLLGNSGIAFIGGCSIPKENMLDGEDLLAGSSISSDLMLHFIFELFDTDLRGAILYQRLFTSLVRDWLSEHGVPERVHRLVRDGDDIYVDKKKLSISVAARGTLSSLIHFAVNLTTSGTPAHLNTASLDSLIDTKVWPAPRCALSWLNLAANELESVGLAAYKVRPVSR